MRDSTPSTTVGIDMASQDADTAICRVRWDGRSATAEYPTEGGVGNGEIVRALLAVRDMGFAGVDSPFGWPEHFVDAVTAHRNDRSWPDRDALGPDSMRRLRYRETDFHVHRECGLWPRSVSSELIALLAMRWAGILDALHVEMGRPVDRSGAGPVVEVYPSAALKRWDLPHRGYKGKPMDPPSRRLRLRVLRGLRERLGCLVMTPATARRLLADDDALDAFVCALVARAAGRGGRGGAVGTPRGRRARGMDRAAHSQRAGAARQRGRRPRERGMSAPVTRYRAAIATSPASTPDAPQAHPC